MGLLDRMIKSGDIIRIEKTDAQEHIYSLVFSHGCFQIEFKDLSKLFIKAFGKALKSKGIEIKEETVPTGLSSKAKAYREYLDNGQKSKPISELWKECGL